MLNGIEANQIFLFLIVAGAASLLFTEWIRIDLTAILNVPIWHNLILTRGGFDPTQVQSWYFVRSDSV
ncbi:MAG TPA: hypothetical protein VFH34_15435 [Anaerolineales bacterium]|nr:hypothetical protein [Anaerolineales bacterium]